MMWIGVVSFLAVVVGAMVVMGAADVPGTGAASRKARGRTVVSVEGDRFLIDGKLTYAGRVHGGMKIEGLLFNARLVQGVFDDMNPETRGRWKYPDGPWDAERNTREFVAAMPVWRAAGLLGFTINLQGGSPEGYSKDQPWVNSAFDEKGHLREAYMKRLEKILDRADELGMVVIVGYFYYKQARRLADEAAVLTACDEATDWLVGRGYRNVMVEIANESNLDFGHKVFGAEGMPGMIRRVQERSKGKVDSAAGRLLVSDSFTGGALVADGIVAVSDFVLLHGNGVGEPGKITKMVQDTRKGAKYRGQPIVFNEDDHFDFAKGESNMLAAVRAGASWGYFDYRMKGEGFEEGYQSVPANWGVSSGRKRGFFGLVAELTGAKGK